jgi:regulator of sigma E protease
MVFATLFGLIKAFLAICFVLGSIALVHEFGHYITAKLTGIWVIEFAIGFGNRILKLKWGETIYSLRPFPLGGFVRLAGMDEPDEEEEKKPEDGKSAPAGEADVPAPAAAEPVSAAASTTPEEEEEKMPVLDPNDPRGYPSKPRWVKILVLSAGSIMNMVWAVVLFFLIAWASDNYPSNILVKGTAQGAPAQAAGMKIGDIITAINGVKLEDWGEGIKTIRANGGKPIVLDVLRDHVRPRSGFAGGVLPGDFAVNPGTFQTMVTEDLKITLTPNGEAGGGQIGIALEPNFDYREARPMPFSKAVLHGFAATVDIIDQTYSGFKRIFTGESQADVAGPVKIMHMIKERSGKGLNELLHLTALLSVNIGIINLMPFPVLDGGRIIFVMLEMVFAFLNFLTGIKLAITPKWEERIHFAGLVFLLMVFVLVTYKDIRSFF